jgi:hypothetical protein
MSHGYHRPDHEERGLLDPECHACQEKIVAELDDTYLRALLGITRQQFAWLTDPRPLADKGLPPFKDAEEEVVATRSLLLAFRYTIRKANALRIGSEVRELVRHGRWPGAEPPAVARP